MLRFHVRERVLPALILVSFLPLLALAAEREVCGVRLTVDQVEVVDNRSTKIALFGESRIIATDGVDAFIVDAYAEQPTRMQPQTSEQLVVGCIQAGKIRLAQSAFRIFLRQAPNVEELRILLRRVSGRPGIGDLIVGSLAHSQALSLAPEVIALLLSSIPPREQEKVRALSEVYSVWGDEVRTAIAGGQLGLLEEEQYEEAERLLSTLRVMYGAEDPVVVRMQRLHAQVSEARSASQAGQPGTIDLLLRSQADPRVQTLLSGFRVRALHKNAEDLIVGGRADEALRALARIEIAKRTPTTHALALRCLETLQPQPTSVIVDVSVDLFLRALVPFDERLHHGYDAALRRQWVALESLGQVRAASVLVETLVSLRPGDAAWAAKLRFEQALKLLAAGHPAEGRALLELVPSLTVGQRLQLFFRGYYFSRLFVVALLFVGFCILAGVLLYKRFRSAAPSMQESRPAVEREPPSADELPQFRRQNKESSWDPELLHALRVLGLEAGADLAAVKSAYRIAVKEYHPDVQSEQSGLASQRFMEITKAYEHILLYVEGGAIVPRREKE